MADAPVLGAGTIGVWVQVPFSAPSMGNEKDIAQETPDFIGGFAVSTVRKKFAILRMRKWCIFLCSRL